MFDRMLLYAMDTTLHQFTVFDPLRYKYTLTTTVDLCLGSSRGESHVEAAGTATHSVPSTQQDMDSEVESLWSFGSPETALPQVPLHCLYRSLLRPP